MRGIIVYPEMRRSGPQGVKVVGGVVDALTIRRAALYWDKIDHPHSQLLYMGLTNDEMALKAAGVLIETKISDPIQTQEILLETPGRALLLHNHAEPGAWALAQSSPDFVLPDTIGRNTRTLEVELHDALPVPTSDTPIEDILQFKHNRSDELLAFRSSMDALYERVLSANDAPRAKDAAIAQLERALADVHRVVDESAIKRVVSSLKVELSLTDLAMAGLLFHSPLAKIAGAAAASIKVAVSMAAGFKNPIPGLKDYAYLGYSAAELGTVPASQFQAGTNQRGSLRMVDGDKQQFGGRPSIGRNDPCFCGSGVKFKKCHGAPKR